LRVAAMSFGGLLSQQGASRPTGGAEVRKIVVYELLSLDGVAEEPDSFIADWDDAMDANLAAVIATQDAVILGRRSYTEWAQFWPGSQIEPFASFINKVTKYVATSTPLDQDWVNATVSLLMNRCTMSAEGRSPLVMTKQRALCSTTAAISARR
jgi:hypothetical protein